MRVNFPTAQPISGFDDPTKLRANKIKQADGSTGPGDDLKSLFDAEMAARNGDIKDAVLKKDGLTRDQFDKLSDARKLEINKEIDKEANLEFVGGEHGAIKGADGLWHAVPDHPDQKFLRSIGFDRTAALLDATKMYQDREKKVGDADTSTDLLE